jgi:uncharacterized protein YutE (UPF0331/DUF86 family)
MTRPEVIRKRLGKLGEYLGNLKKLQRYSREEFLADPEHYGSAERFLHLAIEAVLDMGNHVIADDRIGTVDWYSDIPKLLCDRGLISPDLRDKWIRMIGFRNTLVHEYIEINRDIVFDVLHQGLDDLEELKRLFANFL